MKARLSHLEKYLLIEPKAKSDAKGDKSDAASPVRFTLSENIKLFIYLQPLSPQSPTAVSVPATYSKSSVPHTPKSRSSSDYETSASFGTPYTPKASVSRCSSL